MTAENEPAGFLKNLYFNWNLDAMHMIGLFRIACISKSWFRNKFVQLVCWNRRGYLLRTPLQNETLSASCFPKPGPQAKACGPVWCSPVLLHEILTSWQNDLTPILFPVW